MGRLGQLKKQHGSGDISDREYQTERDSTQAALAQLPDGYRIRTFAAYRARLLALPLAIAAASSARRALVGVPPSGFEPLISTLKGSCPRPLDDGGEARTGV